METIKIKPFSHEIRKILNSEGISVGYEVILKGELIFGSSEEEFKTAQRLAGEITRLSESDVVVIDLKEFDEWHSIGVVNVIGPILALNATLISEKRVPVSLVGDQKKDYFDAVSDKFPEENNTPKLPWFSSVKEFLEHFGIA